MDDGKQNKNIVWQDFLSYLTRAFTNEEAHQFERKVDKSAFDFEAVEGLEPFAGASINYDIENLKEKISSRNSLKQGPRKKNRISMRGIAAVAVIVITGSILSILLLNKEEDIPVLAKNIEQPHDNVTQLAPVAKEEKQDEVAAYKSETAGKKDSDKANAEETDMPVKMKKAEEVEEDEVLSVGLAEADGVDQNETENRNGQTFEVQDQSYSSGSEATVSALKRESPQIKAKSSGAAMKTLAPPPVEITPIKGVKDITRKLKKDLKKNDLKYSGTLTLNLVFFEGKVINAGIKESLPGKVNKVITEFVIRETKWHTKEEKPIPDGIYNFIIELN